MVAAGDDATVSLITEVSMVQQIERLFALMDSISLSADFDGQVPSEQTTVLRNHVSRSDWGSAGHVTKTSARICTTWSCCPVESPCSKGIGEQTAEVCNVSYPKVLVFSDSECRSQLGHELGPSHGRVLECT